MTTTATPPTAPPSASTSVGGELEQQLWTADDLERACEAGVFGFEARLELIHGRIIHKMPISALHAEVADYLADCLRAAFPARLRVREEKPLRITFDGEPVPDISVVVEKGDRYRRHHPTPDDVLLLVEIAVSSAEHDLGEKALLYAQASIQDYWVALPERGQIVVHRAPTPDGYADVTTLGPDDAITPLAAQDVTLAVRDLLGMPAAEEAE